MKIKPPILFIKIGGNKEYYKIVVSTRTSLLFYHVNEGHSLGSAMQSELLPGVSSNHIKGNSVVSTIEAFYSYYSGTVWGGGGKLHN